jgi:pimeloyl-ACP methyl ester carboxylesterase
MTTHIRPTDIHGVSRLAIDATLGLTRLVETMHHNIARAPGPLGTPTDEPTRGITGLVYRSIRGTTRLVGGSIDALLGQLMPLLDREPAASSPKREAVLAAVNGVLGDHLAASGNPLAIAMQLRRDAEALILTADDLAARLPRPGGKLLVLVHGLCMNDRQWLRQGHDHGAALAAAAGYTPLYLHYNSGRHVSRNGHELAALLETLVRAWPVPVEQLTLLGHSMGGLVARSACHYGEREGHAWLASLRQMAFLGTPHLGAPLERGGHWVDVLLEASPYTAALARLGRMRSAGITDLRHGSVVDEDWESGHRAAHGRHPGRVALPAGVRCFALAASMAKSAPGPGRLPRGDGLVPVASALGRHRDRSRRLDFPESQQWVGYGMHHLDLLNHIEVYTRLRDWLG